MRLASIRVLGCTLAMSMLFAPLPLQERLAQYKTQFDNEKDPVRKARILVKLTESQFQQIRTDADSGKTEDGLKDLEQVRDECISTHEALKAKAGDPERKSAGFKELEISVRESLHRLREILAGLSGEDEQHYAKVRAQLEQLNNELIKELFPRQPGSGPQNPKP
jgi:predicted  nucleic acid-binding Zn-ribbon protein